MVKTSSTEAEPLGTISEHDPIAALVRVCDETNPFVNTRQQPRWVDVCAETASGEVDRRSPGESQELTPLDPVPPCHNDVVHKADRRL